MGIGPDGVQREYTQSTTMIRFCGIVAMLFIIGVKAKVEKVCAEVSVASGSSVEIEVDIVMGNGKKYRYDVTSNTVCLNINEDMKDSRIAYLAVQDIYPSTDDVINSFYTEGQVATSRC